MRRVFLPGIMAFGIAGFLALTAVPSLAVHSGSGQIACGNCHTMHSSQGNSQGQSMGFDTGVLKLLRITSSCSADLCLMCHAENGGSGGAQFNSGAWQTTPPKVYLTGGSWAEGSSFDLIGAGGDFRGVGNYTATGFTAQGQDTTADPDGPSAGYGHSICEEDMYPPGGNGGGSEAVVQIPGFFTCVTCHDAHGTVDTQPGINGYRNLLGNINIQGDGKSWSTNIADSYVGTVADSAANGSDPTASGNVWAIANGALNNTYLSDGSGEGQMSRFCAQCHGKWHEGLTSGNVSGDDWRRHPVDHAMVDTSPASGSNITIVDWAHYLAVDTYAGNSDAMKMPVTDGGGLAEAYADDTADKVFCLSCHFAHGGPYYDALRWDYQSGVGVATQVGLGIDSGTGCQQCHNRGGTYGS